MIKSPILLTKKINEAIGRAIKKTLDRLLGQLQIFIDDEYYNKYDPDAYKRTYQFWESAVSEMLTTTCGQLFMDAGKMNYKTGWSGEDQISMANEGVHGGVYTTESLSGHYWDSFIEYYEKM